MDDFSSSRGDNSVSILSSPFQPGSALDELAWQIWSAAGVPVQIQDSQRRRELEPFLRSGLLSEDTEGFKFLDNTVLIEAATRHFVSSNLQDLTGDPKHCFERLHEVWVKEIGKKELVSGHALAILHNLEQLDAFLWAQQAIEAGSNVFNVLNIFEGAILLLVDALPSSILSFFAGHYEKVKNDLAGGRLFSKLAKWFASHPKAAHRTQELHLRDPRESYVSVSCSALQGLASNNFRLGFASITRAARSKETLVSRPALIAMGLADYSKASRSRALSAAIELCHHIVDSAKHPSMSAAVLTLGRLLTYDTRIVDMLIQAGETKDPEALYALSDFLFIHEQTYGERDWFERLLQLLTVTKPEHKGILSNIDMIMMKRIHSVAHQQGVLEFINAWLANQSDGIEGKTLKTAFPDTLAELVRKPELLGQTLTIWLLADDLRFPLAARELVSRLRLSGNKSIRLDATALDGLSLNEFRFLTRRILGYLAGEDVVIPLFFSMVYTQDADKRSFGFVKEVLSNRVGYDYPFQTADYLKLQQNDPRHGEDIKQLCQDIIGMIESRMQTLNVLPDVRELQAPFMKTRRFRIERAHQMDKAFEEANKDSIMSLIATRIPLKAGRRSFQNLDGRFTEPMELKSFSHSIAIPRSETTDPAGAERERMLFRRARRGDP